LPVKPERSSLSLGGHFRRTKKPGEISQLARNSHLLEIQSSLHLDHAKEAIRKLDYAILVEGQMDCISVFAAGFQNVIASSGTAFTELQARLLGRFSKKIVVNFDPDTAGARATERTLALLVEEEFQIQVLTLDPGFDPDLFIRRKGKDAYAAALKNSQRYFDYLIERARAQFPVRSAEGKVKAVNYLLPHIQRVPSRIVRDELAHEIAQKLGIDSAVLRQELKHAATSRSSATLKLPSSRRSPMRKKSSSGRWHLARRCRVRKSISLPVTARRKNSIPHARPNLPSEMRACMLGWLRNR